MEIAIALFILWVVVTLLGHASWVLVRGFFRLITGNMDGPEYRVPVPNEKSDIAATRRVMGRMVREDLLDEEVVTELRHQLHNLEHLKTPRAIHPYSQQIHSSVLPPQEHPESQDSLSDPHVIKDAVREEPLLATLADDPSARPASMPATPPPVTTPHSTPPIGDQAVPGPPVLSKSEVIQSFLAAHNIRWGELVAGMLIVVCSIGLVISLWSPLVETHRVIPSLIFLGANGAIYAAGLYTLSRWRLRHTSRAVLVIATLLVPLSVLAGLAAAGTSADAVQLTDPITLGAIALAGAIYIFLLYLGGKALSCRWYAVPIVTAVAGPVSILPLVPASVRSFGPDTGWLIGIGSVALMLASVYIVRPGKRVCDSIGIAGGRARLLVMAFGSFALAVSIGYLAFAVRDFGLEAMLPIAIATVPALVALAGTSRSLMTAARSSTQAMSGAVVCVILIGLAWTILPPSMIAARWVWSWALVFSVSAVVVGWIFRQPRWLALSTIPVGMAATFSAPVWLGDQSWDAIALWRRLVGGEPMLAASLMAVLVAAAGQAFRDPDRRTWMRYAAIGWAGVAVAIASVLSIAPATTLGVAPWWSVTCVLVVVAVASVVLAMRHQTWSLVTVGATVFAWLSVFRPIEWGVTLGSPAVWMMTTVAIAATMIILREVVPRWQLSIARDPQASKRSLVTWGTSATVASVVAAVIACCFVRDDWSASAMTLAAASAILFWSSTTSRSIGVLRISQLATVALSVVVGYGRFWPWLLAEEAWTSGLALWTWAIVAGIIAVFWMLIRECSRLNLSLPGANEIRRRCRFLAADQAAPTVMPDGWVAIIATALACFGSAWSFGVLVLQAGGSNLDAYDSRFLLPVAALSICGSVAWWIRRHDHRLWSQLGSSLVVACLVWGASQFAHILAVADTTKLVAATTLAACGCFAIPRWVLSRTSATFSTAVDRLAIVVAPSLIAVASVVLLMVGWFDPITEGTYAHAFPSLAVATWWMVAAAALLWKTKQTPKGVFGIGSALLAPAATAVVVPVFSLSGPVVWVQTAAIASIVWIASCRIWLKDEESDVTEDAIGGSMLFALVVGVASSILVTASIVLNMTELHPVFGLAGFIISLLSVGLWCLGWVPLPRGVIVSDQQLPLPIGLSILAGQFAWLSYVVNLISGPQVIELVLAIWAVASVASLVRYRSEAKAADFIHIGLICVANTLITFLVGVRSELMPWLALATLTVGGIAVAFVGNGPVADKIRYGASRLLGWFVVGAGGLLLVSRIAAGTSPQVEWTLVVIWSAVWVVVWRLVCPDRPAVSDQPQHALLAIPDTEFAVLLLVAAIGETILCTMAGRSAFPTSTLADPLLWGRVMAYVAVGVSTIARASRNVVWTTAIGTLVAVASLVSVQISIHFEATSNQRFVWATLPSGFAIALMAHWLPALANSLSRLVHGAPAAHLRRLIDSTWQVALVVAGGGGLSAAAMIIGGAPPADTNLTIVTVALAAWAIAAMAEASAGPRLRHAAVTVALIAIGFWASVDSGETSHPVLTASMRWLVASAFTIPMVLFVFPKLLGESISIRWRDAFQRGALVAGIASMWSLISMLAMEAGLRTPSGIQDVPAPMVMGVAVTLAILSVLAGLVAILTGPGSSWQQRLELSDQQRRLLIIAAQVVGGVTWLHVFLCRPDWAFIGLRAYWPYIVMGLAFISVGATEWARRRSDEVLSQTLTQTALYLPLLPVVGFWLSGSIEEFGWAFEGGKVRYDLLLALGAVYYIGISAMWKGVIPRVAAIVLGNAAWWVVLVQMPGWGFLTHPQAWLIPPAVCVLVVAHLYRERLQPALASGIRYGSTLVIYISSTADMLLQQIGTNLSGPIILILLALAGMAAGVVLRVRPFLYLGAMFVFLGVTSMVWHAHRAFDAVWPWWVFGITTGICLLAFLMALEKNKPKLREYANRLATWQG